MHYRNGKNIKYHNEKIGNLNFNLNKSEMEGYQHYLKDHVLQSLFYTKKVMSLIMKRTRCTSRSYNV